MFIILAHTHTEAGPGLQVARRANGTPALFESKVLADIMAERWNRILGRTGLTQHWYYHSYEIRG